MSDRRLPRAALKALGLRVPLAAVLGLLTLVLWMQFFESLPIEGTSLGIDWRKLWLAFEGGTLHYGGTALRNPPWSVLPVSPLGLLSFRTSWALLTLATFACLVASVPRFASTRVWLVGTLLLVSSYPAIRHAADGNFEGLVIGGVLLALYGLRAQSPAWLVGGLLLATAKPQETWLPVVYLAYLTVRGWPIRRWAAAGVLVAVVVIPLLALYGEGWIGAMVSIPQRGGIMDISLLATASRLLLPAWAGVAVSAIILLSSIAAVGVHPAQQIRARLGLLIAASLLLAPYSAGNSLLTVLAIGLIPSLASYPKSTLVAVAMLDAPYLARMLSNEPGVWQATYWTGVLLAVWALQAWQVLHRTDRSGRSDV